MEGFVCLCLTWGIWTHAQKLLAQAPVSGTWAGSPGVCGPAPLPGAKAERPREHHGAQPHGLGLGLGDLYASVSSTTEGDHNASSGEGWGQPAPGTSWLPFLCHGQPTCTACSGLASWCSQERDCIGQPEIWHRRTRPGHLPSPVKGSDLVFIVLDMSQEAFSPGTQWK